MGKPSSSISRRSSSHSYSSNMSNDKQNKVNNYLRRINKRQRKQQILDRSKTNKSIHKLFEQLREASQDLQRSSLDNVIDLDDTQNTIIENTNEVEQAKSVIVIPDDANTTPKKRISLYHSTPLSKKNSLDEAILAQSNNNLSIQNFNETKNINADSYLTIDLTTDTGLNKSVNQTVIDLDATESDCALVSINNSDVSMSGDSDVTVIRNQTSKKLKKFTRGIANLNASEKGKLLEMITKTIFNGCSVPASVQTSVSNLQKSLPRVSETPEDTYIKQVILGNPSRSSIGSNVYHPARQTVKKTGLRMIVIDGSNVAMEHGRGSRFSVRGLQICIDYFLRRGHVVKAFVPRFRCKMGMSTDGRLLDFLERQGLVIYTPSRQIQGRNVTPYDDRYILQCAAEFDGIVVSGDNYRDLIHENPKWKFVIENRILPFTWVDDMIMFPRDPLGRNGPTLESFLKH